jgi:phosphoglycolate phosphatase-like HAD superfamily hydrolase
LERKNMLDVIGLAFDFDGTLVDISKPYSMAFKKTLSDFGLPECDPIDLYRRGATDLNAQFRHVISRNGGKRSLEQQCVQRHCEIYEQIHLHYLTGVDNALLAVRELASKGFKLAIVGGRPISQVEPELKFLNIQDYFSPVLTSDAVNHPKPAPDMVQQVAKFWSTSTNRILVVGDSPDDIASAKSAGAFSAGICCGYFPKDVIAKARPDFLLDSVPDILQIV